MYTKDDERYRFWEDPKTMALLENAFKLGCTDAEACLHAHITKDQLYYFQRKIDKEYNQKKAIWKETPALKSRFNLIQSLEVEEVPVLNSFGQPVYDKEGNLLMAERPADKARRINNSKWYLERKKKDEFSTRNELTGKDGESLIGDEEYDQMKKSLAILASSVLKSVEKQKKEVKKEEPKNAGDNPTSPEQETPLISA